MPSTYSPSLRLELIGNGEQAGNWGNTTNTNIGTLLEQAITGVENILMTGSTTLTIGNGVADQARNAVLVLTGTLSSSADLIVPAVEKVYLVKNSTSNSQTVTVKTAAGTGVAIGNGFTQFVYCDGTNVYAATSSLNPSAPPGTVSSVQLAAGSTGLLISGASSQTITTTGTFTLGGTLAVGSGGTGRSTLPASGSLLISNGSAYNPGTVSGGNAITTTYNGTDLVINNAGVTSLTAGTNITLSGSTGNITISAISGGGSAGVTSFAGGTTGLTPSTASAGAITLGGTLAVSNGGTGATTLTGYVKGTGTSSLTASSTIPVTDLSGAIGVANGGTGTTTAFTSGAVVFAGASGVYSQDPTQLFWDNTNNRLGIGTSSPSQTLSVSGNSIVTGTSYFADSQYYSLISGTTAYMNFGSGAWIEYQRSASKFVGYIGSSATFVAEASNFQFNSGYGSVATAYGCRAWVSFVGSTASIRASGNVTSVTRNATGDFTVNFTNAMPNVNYAVTALGCATTDGDTSALRGAMLYGPSAQQTGSVRLIFENGINTSTYDPPLANVVVFR